MSEKTELTALGLQVEYLLERKHWLQEENRMLRQKLAKLAHEHTQLNEKNKAAGQRVRNIIQQLKKQLS